MTMYFIALVLPSALNEKILHWKNFMHQRYDCKVGLKSPAHITIIPPFWMEESKEVELFHDVGQISKKILPFIVRTKSFSAFKPRTIFIDMKKNIDLNSLKENADDFFKPNNYCKIKVDSRAFHPHITIATRDLFKKNFYEAWPVFEKEIFEEEWMADGLSVLRHNKKNWDVVYTSQFIIGSKA